MKARVMVFAAFCGLGCGSSTGPSEEQVACYEVQYQAFAEQNRAVDILFVVDTSASMLDHAALLSESAARFALVLENIEGGIPDIHVAVVSSDVAARGGSFEDEPRVSGCPLPSGGFLRDGYAGGPTRVTNYDGELADVFQCMFELPPSTTTIEQPLEAMKRALDGSNPGNDGFLREHAYLVVVIVGDEDDCSGDLGLEPGESEARSAWRCFDDAVRCDQDTASAGAKTGCTARETPRSLEPTAGYAEFLRGLKQYEELIVMASVLTDADPVVIDEGAGGRAALESSCGAADASAWPTVRLRDVLERFPQRYAAASACDDDWSETLILVAELMRKVLGSACIDPSIDLEPDVPGIQDDCWVAEVYRDDAGDQQVVPLPRCSTVEPPATERPCWIPRENSRCQERFELESYRSPETHPRAHIEARCFAGCY